MVNQKKKFKKIDLKIENEINNFNRQALHANFSCSYN